MDKITIVIPVYNTEDYLSRCVESILCQTYQNFEILLVDDGSTDGSPALCDGYAEKDLRIRAFHISNGGPSKARNYGISWACDHSDSQWLCYIDSDDWVHPKMLECLLQSALSENADISICGVTETRGEEPAISQEKFTPELWNPDDFFVEHNMVAVIPCAKLYRKETFAGRRYPEGKIHEDEYLTYQVLFEQKKLIFVPAPMYFYFYNPKGITKSSWRPQRMDVWGAMEQQIAFFQQTGRKRLEDDCLHRYMRNAYGQMMEIRTEGLMEQYPEEYTLVRAKTLELLKRCHIHNAMTFENDFVVLKEFFPIRTQLWLYCLAAQRRIKKLFHK